MKKETLMCKKKEVEKEGKVDESKNSGLFFLFGNLFLFIFAKTIENNIH